MCCTKIASMARFEAAARYLLVNGVLAIDRKPILDLTDEAYVFRRQRDSLN